MLSDIFNPARIKLNLEGITKTDVFEELIGTFAGSYPEYNSKELLKAVNLRENKMNTVILPGVAVPHGYCTTIDGIMGAIGFSPAGIEYNSPVQKPVPGEAFLRQPVHLFFMLFMDESSQEKHLLVLSRLMDLFNSDAFARIRSMEAPGEVYDLLRCF